MNLLKHLEFELEIHETIQATPVTICGKFLTTVKMAHYVKIDKIKSFLKSYHFQPKVRVMTYIFT